MRHSRFLAVGLAATLLVSACGGDDGGSESSDGTGGEQAATDLPPCPIEALTAATAPVEVTVWHGYTAKTAEALDALAADYNASQAKVVVKVEQQTSYEELWKKYQSGIASSQLPGIAIPDDTVTKQIIDSGTVLPAQSCIDATDYDISQLLETSRSYYTIDGVLYPASLNTSAALLYYNKNHFRKAGLDPEKTPGTLDEMREYAQKLKEAGVPANDPPIILNLSPSILEMFLTGAGIPVVDNDNGRGDGETTASTYADPRTVELFTWVQDMIADGLLEVVPSIDNQFDHYLAMADQSASMTIETSTAATSVEAFLGGDLDVGALPDAAGEVDGSAIDLEALDIGAGVVPGIDEPGQLQMGGGAWYITNTTPDEVQAAAWDFLSWFNEPAQQATWSAKGSYLPYNTKALDEPELQAAWTDSLAGRWLALAYDELATGIDPDFPGPLMGPYEQFRAAQRKAIDELVFTGGEPQAVADEVQETTTAALEQYNEENF